MLPREGRPRNWARILISLAAATGLAAVASMTWTEPIPTAEGQTIPWLTYTATRQPTGILAPTHTPTPRPTWTLVPTTARLTPSKTPVEPIATPTRGQGSATPTTMPGSAPTAAPPEATQATVTALPSTPSPTAGPIALLFEVAAEPQLAGPGDEIHFTVQVANVGYNPITEACVIAVLPADLSARATNCSRCTVIQSAGQTALDLGSLPGGSQTIFDVWVLVAEDAWPGQRLVTGWTITARGQIPQTIAVITELPWAELPATGGDAGCGENPRQRDGERP